MADISFNCPHCATNLVVEEEGAGLDVPCPVCAVDIVIPDPRRGDEGAEIVEPGDASEAAAREPEPLPEAAPPEEISRVPEAAPVEPADIPEAAPEEPLTPAPPPPGPVESLIYNLVEFDHWIEPDVPAGASARPRRAWREGRVIAVRAAAIFLLAGLSAYLLYRLSTGGFDPSERRNRELMHQPVPSPPLEKLVHRKLARAAVRMMRSPTPEPVIAEPRPTTSLPLPVLHAAWQRTESGRVIQPLIRHALGAPPPLHISPTRLAGLASGIHLSRRIAAHAIDHLPTSRRLEVAPAHPVAPSDNSGILAAAAAARSCSALVQPLRWAAVVDAAIRQYFALSDPIPRLYYVRNGRHIEVAKSSLTPETYPHLMYALSENDPETDTVVHVLKVHTATNPGGFYLTVPEIGGQPRIDWDIFIQGNARTFERFIEEKPRARQTFRLLLERSHYFKDDVPGLDGKMCFRVSKTSENMPEVFAFIDKQAPVAAAARERIKWGLGTPVIATLAWSWEGSPDSPPHVEITGIQSFKWLQL